MTKHFFISSNTLQHHERNIAISLGIKIKIKIYNLFYFEKFSFLKVLQAIFEVANVKNRILLG